MQTASFNGIIKTIFYLMLFYYVIKFLARLFLPIVVKKVVEKAGQNFQQHYQSNTSNHQKNSTTDEIIYDATKSTKPRETKKVGEYVDYEEID
jgi:DNA integrity scanning protein DisA with diadenylate cyclase activity